MARRTKKAKGKPGAGEWFVLDNSPMPAKVASKVQRAAEIVERRYGEFTPKTLVEYSKQPSAVTHSLFQWDLRKAAYQHWLAIARGLCACVHKKIIIQGAPTIVRSLYNIKPMDGKHRRYVQREVFMGDVELRKQKSEDLLLQLMAIVDSANTAQLHDLVPAWKRVYAAVESFPPTAEASVAV